MESEVAIGYELRDVDKRPERTFGQGQQENEVIIEIWNRRVVDRAAGGGGMPGGERSGRWWAVRHVGGGGALKSTSRA